jgi:hypothetical protein
MAPFLGTHIFFRYNKNKIRKEIAGKIHSGPDKKDLVLLKFAEEEAETKLNWKHADEFEFKGQMYDIVEKDQEGDTTWYYCFKDDTETRLNREKDSLLASAIGRDPRQKSQTDRLTDFLKTVYQQDVFSWTPHAASTTVFHFSFLIFNYSSLSFPPLSPPPKMG